MDFRDDEIYINNIHKDDLIELYFINYSSKDIHIDLLIEGLDAIPEDDEKFWWFLLKIIIYVVSGILFCIIVYCII